MQGIVLCLNYVFANIGLTALYSPDFQWIFWFWQHFLPFVKFFS